MDDPITLYSSQDLTTLARNNEVQTLDEPSDELTGRYQYSISRAAFQDAYTHWNHDASPLLTLRDMLSSADIFLGKPSAARIHTALENNQTTVQLA